ncbi:hypothetical protein T12_4983 [Trichinella patagoniensis]|uniref:Uncharacterized protein n=1 Tax=Trichinella patagoniensis TaxID=990121 RepID=A0A0V0Z9L7_9BILA|nr:hypothetical protein T12_4983 [Trichinella patagoniensis]
MGIELSPSGTKPPPVARGIPTARFRSGHSGHSPSERHFLPLRSTRDAALRLGP